MSMAFLNQAMLWGLLAVSIPVIVHLIHRRKARRLPFPALDFILRSRKAVARRFRLKQLLLLVMRSLLVAAVALAAARPLFAGRDASVGPSGGPAAVAIAIDTSFSMRARAGSQTAFQAARDAALVLVNGLGPDVEAVIVPFGEDARTIPAVPTADKAALAAAVKALEPGWTGTDVGRALDTAAAALAGSEKPRKIVYLFSDAAAPSWGEVTPRDPAQKISWRLIDVSGVGQANAVVLSLEVHEDGSGALARVQARSYSDKPVVGAAVELSANDHPAGRNFLDMDPGGAASTQFTLAAPPAGLNVAVARLAPDVLTEDDAHWAVFRGRARVRTLLVDGDPKTTIREAETFYLERSLAPSRAATSSVVPVVVDTEGLARANLAQYDVVVLANVGALPGLTVINLKRWVQNGGGLLYTVGDKVDTDAANGSIGDLLAMRLRGMREGKSAHSEGGATETRMLNLGPVPGKHPVTTQLDAEAEDVLAGTRFHKTELLEGAAAGAITILKFSDGSPALVERPVGRGRVAILASSIDRDWNDLPIATVYLPLMRRLIRHLAGELGEGGATDVMVGKAVQVETGELKAVRVDGPPGFAPEVVTAVDGAIEVMPAIPGVYRLSREDGTPDERLAAKGFAANIDTVESDLRDVGEADLARVFQGVDFSTSGGMDDTPTGSSGPTPDRPLWGLLLGLGMLALMMEGAASQL